MFHKINLYNTALDFSTDPVLIQSNISETMNIRVSGGTQARYNMADTLLDLSGRTIGSSGTRIWDSTGTPQSLYEGNGANILVTPSSPFVCRFTNQFLPQNLFDALVFISLNYRSPIRIGVSNSPDNFGVYSSVPLNMEIGVFFVGLHCMGLGGSTYGNPNTNSPYMFGGGSAVSLDYIAPNNGSGSRVSPQITIILTKTKPFLMTFSITAQYFTAASVPFGHIFTESLPIFPNSPIATSALSTDFMINENIRLGYGSLVNLPGYFKISASLNNSDYRSLLPFYHWGLA